MLGASWGDGGPDVIEGRSVWMRADRVVRVLRPGEAHDDATQELRLFSAGWLSFALMYAVAGHVVERRIRGMRPLGSDAV